MRSSAFTPETAWRRSARGSRWPSVATIATLSGFSNSKAPFRVYRLSSCETAKAVLSISPASTSAGSVTAGFAFAGKAGKLSVPRPTSLNEDRWQVTCTQRFSRSLK